MNKGDKVLVYTDGVTEYAREDGEMYGEDRLHGLLAGCGLEPVAEVVRRIDASLAEFAGGDAPRDDVTVLGMEFLG